MYFQTTKGLSTNPSQPFIWCADYLDGTHLLEFDERTRKENGFYNIKKSQLLNFGLIGGGYKFYFNTLDGTFNVANRNVSFKYIDNDGTEYLLNDSKQNLYNDIIQFKRSESTFNLFSQNGKIKSNIESFNIGYKKKLKFNDIEIGFQAIFVMELGKPIYFDLNMISNKDLNGKFVITRNGQDIEWFDAPLHVKRTGTLKWNII